jgi:phage tail sheath protein FI
MTETPDDVRTITGVATSIAAFLGRAAVGPINEPAMISSFGDFEQQFGGLGTGYPMSDAVRAFFVNGGSHAIIVRLSNDPATLADGSHSQPLDLAAYQGSKVDKTGLYALDKADLFNLLCIPPDTREGDTPPAVYQTAMAYCAERRALLIVDSPAAWSADAGTAAAMARDGLGALGLSGEAARNAALYFPRVLEADPLRHSQLDTFVPCGHVAGIMARTDTTRGVWKAPAGLHAAINGIQGLNVTLNDAESGMLNPLGINSLRAFPGSGCVVWGARTLRGADQLADEYKYVPVRRAALFIEESVYRGTRWAVVEPNAEPLWSQIRLHVGAFMHNLFRQGAFQGSTPREAYFVTCDEATTTQDDINLGIVNIVVGFAPLKAAEFVVLTIQQIAGDAPDRDSDP